MAIEIRGLKDGEWLFVDCPEALLAGSFRSDSIHLAVKKMPGTPRLASANIVDNLTNTKYQVTCIKGTPELLVGTIGCELPEQMTAEDRLQVQTILQLCAAKATGKFPPMFAPVWRQLHAAIRI